ncbi:MAG TPA: hypothetical protein PK987_00565 [Ferruginibacter sp.]|nr:hypothetical protein [Ferruginibacter sp.]
MSFFKKQTTALGFILLTALPLFFAAGIFIKQTILHQQRRVRFKTEKIETIRLSVSEIVWVKKGKEILHEGKLFDVKSFKTSGTIAEFTGFYDLKEDKLVKKLIGLIEQNDDASNLVNQVLITFVFYPKNNEVNIITIQNSWEIIKHQFPVFSEVITRLVYPAPAPPPKFC